MRYHDGGEWGNKNVSRAGGPQTPVSYHLVVCSDYVPADRGQQLRNACFICAFVTVTFIKLVNICHFIKNPCQIYYLFKRRRGDTFSGLSSVS